MHACVGVLFMGGWGCEVGCDEKKVGQGRHLIFKGRRGLLLFVLAPASLLSIPPPLYAHMCKHTLALPPVFFKLKSYMSVKNIVFNRTLC